jgi:PAS domain S-box-containing protein
MDMNRAAVAMFGHELAAVRGQSVAIIVPERLHTAHETSMTRARESGTMTLTGKRSLLPAKHREGREFPVEIGLSMWQAPGERGFTAVLRDMTEAQATAAKLKANQEEIEHLVQTLRAANDQLREGARHKDAFMAAMSHELRTPLTVILSYAQLLSDGLHGNITERQRQSLETITQSGQGLLLLIGEILDLAKIESGKLTLNMDTIRITILGRTCVDMLQPLAKSKQIRLLADIQPGLPSLRGDPQRINQILVNLLGNAIKFTPAGGTVTLTAAPTPDFLSVQFTVADTGIGIAPENLSRLFQPFVQIDSKLARSYSGTGLGLAMVAKLAGLHGGTTSVESKVGVGSKFTVTLPFNGPPAPAEEAQPGTA